MAGPESLLDLDRMPPITLHQAGLCLLLRPRIERLAADVWLLAQKSPALVADPALVLTATRLAGELRRMLAGEPGRHLLPSGFAPGIALHALALALRQMQTALILFMARREPEKPGRTTADELEDINRLQALILRDLAGRTAENNRIDLPPELRTASLPPPPAPPGKPPARKPVVRRTILRRYNGRRRTSRAG